MTRYKSTLEIYRGSEGAYAREPLPYDLTDAFDLGVWVALLLYSASAAFSASESSDSLAGNAAPSLWELEQDLSALASNARAAFGDPRAEKLTSRDGQAAALTVLAALFPPAEDEENIKAHSTSAVPDVPPDLWQAASALLETPDEEVPDGAEQSAGQENHAQEADASADADRVVEASYPHEIRQRFLAQPLVAVIYAARLALGGTLTQSAAARRLDITPARVNKLVGQGRFRHIRLGRAVVLLEEEVSIGLRDHRSLRV